MDKLTQIQVGLGDAPQNKYWYGQVEIQKVTVSAWNALAAYEQSLVNNPNRYNTYLGAALAAEKMKDMDKAKEYYEKLIALKGEFTSNRESLEHAKEVVAKANVI